MTPKPATLTPTRARRLRRALLDWYLKSRRDLPWRQNRDPYRIWVSEIMLQQTRVDTVIPFFLRFVAKWPTVFALAKADPEQVRALWSGLGYYRRAQLMLSAAKVIAHDYGGEMPQTLVGLRTLPGVGRYTAGAIASIAYELETGAVDGNVARVLTRIIALRTEDPRGDKLWALADQLSKGPSPSQFNQALIELGALICTAKKPACDRCPARPHCEAHRQQIVDQLPRPKKRPKRSRLELTALMSLKKPHHAFLQQRSKDGLFPGLWCPPMFDGHLTRHELAARCQKTDRWALKNLEEVGEIKHVLTHRDIFMRVYRTRTPMPAASSGRYVDLQKLADHGVPAITAKALKATVPEAWQARVHVPGRKPSRTAPTKPTLANRK